MCRTNMKEDAHRDVVKLKASWLDITGAYEKKTSGERWEHELSAEYLSLPRDAIMNAVVILYLTHSLRKFCKYCMVNFFVRKAVQIKIHGQIE
jgi:hypothetical protein